MRASPAAVRRPRLGAQPGPRREALGHEVARNRVEHRQRLFALAARQQQPAELAGRLSLRGSSSRARRSDSSSSAAPRAVGLARHEAVEELLDLGGGIAPVNSSTTLPSRNALTAGMPLIPNAAAICWLASVSSFASSTSPSRLAAAASSAGRQRAAGAAPLGPEVDDHRDLARALDDALLELRLVTSKTMDLRYTCSRQNCRPPRTSPAGAGPPRRRPRARSGRRTSAPGSARRRPAGATKSGSAKRKRTTASSLSSGTAVALSPRIRIVQWFGGCAGPPSVPRSST